MEVVESAGQLDSYLGIVQIHMEVVDYPRQPGSYPSMVQIHMEIIEAAECRAARQLPWRGPKLHGVCHSRIIDVFHYIFTFRG